MELFLAKPSTSISIRQSPTAYDSLPFDAQGPMQTQQPPFSRGRGQASEELAETTFQQFTTSDCPTAAEQKFHNFEVLEALNRRQNDVIGEVTAETLRHDALSN